MEKNFIIFSEEDIPRILDIFDKGTDEGGYIIDKETKLRIVSNEGEEILAKDLGNVIKGSEIFIKADIASFSKFIAERGDEFLENDE